jgi:sulfoxide reductase catalytic subunit YedY
MERYCEVGRRPHENSHRIGAANTGSESRRLFSFGEARHGGPYYNTQSLDNLLKPQCLLASHMNGRQLAQLFGAPLRLRVENQLAYKMVKWIERIELIESEKMLVNGEGCKNEDDEYFDLLPNI